MCTAARGGAGRRRRNPIPPGGFSQPGRTMVGRASPTSPRAGGNYVVPDFANVGDVGGSLLPMADQIRRSVAWVYNNAKSFGGDPERIYVSGQSSGGHWIGVVMTTDWKAYGVPMTVIKGGASGSGMYDLKPVRLSKRSEFVKFTDETEEKLSAQRHLDKLVAPIALVYG